MTLPSLRAPALALAAGLALVVPAAAEDYALYGEALTWQLQPPGGGAPSTIVGTFHIIDPALEPIVADALERLEALGALMVEVDMAAAAGALPALMPLPEGRTLPAIVGDDAYARVAAVAAEYGIPEEGLRRLSPWAVTLMITPPVEQYERMAAGEVPFDMRLLDAAVAAGLPVATLETFEEQIAAFGGSNESDQVALLVQTVAIHDRMPALLDSMLARYVAGDLAGTGVLAVEALRTDDPATDARILAALMDDRNRRMAERMAPLLAERPYLVAIGALHLPGETGVLNLLAGAGWTVVPAP